MEAFDTILARCNTFAKLQYLRSYITEYEELCKVKIHIQDNINNKYSDELLKAKLDIQVKIHERELLKIISLIDNQDQVDAELARHAEEANRKFRLAQANAKKKAGAKTS